MTATGFVITIALAHSAASLHVKTTGEGGRNLGSDGMKCSATVAYAFLTPGDLPLWPVWAEYFRGCPAGSFTVLVHTQTEGAANVVSSVGGEVLPPSETVQGDLRFSFRNVDAMLNLFGGVQARPAAPNGCRPQWVHLSSESCAPVAPCDKLHAYMEQYPSESFIDLFRPNPPINNVWKTLQWVTLASEHAFALVKDREALRAIWGNAQQGCCVSYQGVDYNGAVEEFVWPQALLSKGFKLHGQKSFTRVEWPIIVDGHPLSYHSANEARSAIKRALDTGYFFARKFVDSHEITEALLQNLRQQRIQPETIGCNIDVLLTSHRGQHLEDRNGVVGLHAATGSLQKWAIIDAGNDGLFIKSHRNMQLEDRNGVVGLHAGTGSDQKWAIINAGNDRVFIKSHRNMQLEDRNGVVGLHADTGSYQTWAIAKTSGGTCSSEDFQAPSLSLSLPHERQGATSKGEQGPRKGKGKGKGKGKRE